MSPVNPLAPCLPLVSAVACWIRSPSCSMRTGTVPAAVHGETDFRPGDSVDAAQFVTDARVVEAIRLIRALSRDHQYSDLVDAAGHQYVDFVMEGGGVLGVALLGYTYALEQAGIRFLGLGGTSAGSVNALMLAALDVPESAKAERLIEILADIPLESFIDGDGDARDFTQALLNKAGMFKLLWKATQVVDNLKDDLGINPGTRFLEWLQKSLRDVGIRTVADLTAKLDQRPAGLHIRPGVRDGKPITDEDCRPYLALVAADVTTQTKVEFPRMAELYWQQPTLVDPALFVRASMSVPLFFAPLKVTNCPQDTDARWAALADFHGQPPKEVLFVDGGIMSNFPIDIFHQPDRVPLNPTFGVKLGIDRRSHNVISSPSSYVGAIFDSARSTLDLDFIRRNPDFRHLVKEIDTGDHNWLDFRLDAKAKIDLFARGAMAAQAFLSQFRWDEYKELRAALAGAQKRSKALSS
ncbi:MAG: patatin-like phospholipase family protein [Burkholderiales bacterium]|nr:patatin-like phospholipase family protein [Burkholderiales bacterium]